MTRNYSRNTFLRQTPNKILKEYFTRKGLLTGVDFDSLPEAEIEPIAEALDQLGDEQRTDVEAEFRLVNEMACEMGVRRWMIFSHNWPKGSAFLMRRS
jgi:hypothetical protein